MNISEYKRKVELLIDDIPSIVQKIIYDNEITIIDLNREEKIFKKGIDVNGSILGLYSKTKNGIGKGFPKQKNNRYNLFDKGNLYNSYDITTNGFKLKITNKDGKVNSLQVIVGEFLGLTKENQELLNNKIILPELLKEINKIL